MNKTEIYQPKARWLRMLVNQIGAEAIGKIPAVKVNGVASDSRLIKPGYAFVAIKGASSDGLDYLPQAAKLGAAVVVSDRPAPAACQLPYLQLKGDMRRHSAYLAAAVHGFPARRLCMIGVTGTDGKTTTASMIYQILHQAGKRVGMISTVNAVIGDEVLDTGFHVTTPDAPEIQAYLGEMTARGIKICILETTSHALAQGRVIACDYDIAAITNVTHEHLDYHGDYQHYLEAKGRLFEMLSLAPPKTFGKIGLAVLNKDDDSYSYLKHVSPVKQLSYSKVNEADLWADEIVDSPEALSFRLHIGEETATVTTPMLGAYNVSNCLAAIAVTCLGLGIPLEKVINALGSLLGVPGRMEKIDLGQDFLAIVDFAHTPNGLEKALKVARTLSKGKVITVFGSAGLRDREKRKMMPKVAIANADYTILTAEDPRTESLGDILADMANSAIEAGGSENKNFWRVPDRGDALRKAVSLAQPGDVVIACGKGHEQSMCFGKTEYPWDDRIALKAAIAESLGQLPSEPMPVLPTSR